MRNFLQLVAIVLFLSVRSGYSQNALNTTLLGHLPYSKDLSDVRGAYHNGREYALVGIKNGLSIVDVTDPTAPIEVYFKTGPSSVWRDPFYHNGHAFCVTEGGGGLLIVDMSPLPLSSALSSTLYTGILYPFQSAHNMFIDGANNKAYIFGTDNIDGAIILDISDPMHPVELGIWNDFYIHDGFVRGDTLWAACLEEGTFLVDVSNPSAPVVLSNWDTPSYFSHNVWPSDNNATCYTTDEVSSGFVAAYDMTDLQNVVETDKVRHPLSSGVIPHNAHFLNNYVVTSHYRDGLVVYDVSDPSNMVLTGYYDTSPFSGNGFNGAWGTWPYLPSGNVLVADIEQGLFILGVDYVRAARLKGTVTAAGSGTPLNAVQVQIAGANTTTTTDLFGKYATGTATAGTYDIIFQKAGYVAQTIANVTLTNGLTEIVDVQLVSDAPFNLTGTVVIAGTSTPIAGATVLFENEFFSKQLTTDENGIYTDNAFFAGEYEVTVGSWGFLGTCQTRIVSAGTAPQLELMPGYADDFSLDLGWSVSGDATTGIWERATPVGTTYNEQFSNPDSDAGSACGTQAYITGNGGGDAGDDDVDDGATILRSPSMDLTSLQDPTIRFDYWFLNTGGSDNNPNDPFLLKIDDGTTVTQLASLPRTNSQWHSYSLPLSELVTITPTMSLIIETADVAPGHLLEGGFDNFRVTEATGITDGPSAAISVFPNPTNTFVNVLVNGPVNKGSLQFVDVSGRNVGSIHRIVEGMNVIAVPNSSGVYICELMVNDHQKVERLVIHN